MKTDELLRRLGAVAARAPAAETNVIPNVLAALRERELSDERPLAWIAGVSSVAAVPLSILGFFALESLTDPILGALWWIRWMI